MVVVVVLVAVAVPVAELAAAATAVQWSVVIVQYERMLRMTTIVNGRFSDVLVLVVPVFTTSSVM